MKELARHTHRDDGGAAGGAVPRARRAHRGGAAGAAGCGGDGEAQGVGLREAALREQGEDRPGTGAARGAPQEGAGELAAEATGSGGGGGGGGE